MFNHIGHLSRNMENWKIEKIKLGLKTNVASRLYIYIYITMYKVLRESIRNWVSNDNSKIDWSNEWKCGIEEVTWKYNNLHPPIWCPWPPYQNSCCGILWLTSGSVSLWRIPQSWVNDGIKLLALVQHSALPYADHHICLFISFYFLLWWCAKGAAVITKGKQ